MFIWGGISLDIRSEISFYSDALVEPLNMISDRTYDNIPLQMKILNVVIPILMYFLHIENTLFCAKCKLRQ